VIVSDCWLAELDEVLKGKAPDWEAAIQRVVERAVTLRAALPETVRARCDTQVAKTLAPDGGPCSSPARRGTPTDGGGRRPGLEARETAKAIAIWARSWLDALAERDLGVVNPVLQAALIDRAGETPKVKAYAAQRCGATAKRPAMVEAACEPWIAEAEAPGLEL